MDNSVTIKVKKYFLQRDIKCFSENQIEFNELDKLTVSKRFFNNSFLFDIQIIISEFYYISIQKNWFSII